MFKNITLKKVAYATGATVVVGGLGYLAYRQWNSAAAEVLVDTVMEATSDTLDVASESTSEVVSSISNLLNTF